MKKYYVRDGNVCHSNEGMEDDCGVMYDPVEVDARIAELEAAFKSSSLLSGEVIEERNRRIAELEREVTHLTRQRDQTAEKLHAAEARIQALSFG
jgi:hypothetical protein